MVHIFGVLCIPLHLPSFAHHYTKIHSLYVTVVLSFSPVYRIPLYVHTGNDLSTLLMTCGLLWAIANFTAMNTLVHVSLGIYACIFLGL